MPKINLNKERLFNADVTVVMPTEDKGNDQTLVLDTVFCFPKPGEVWVPSVLVKDIKNLEEIIEIEEGVERKGVIKQLCLHPCFAPAFVRAFEENTQGKNTRS